MNDHLQCSPERLRGPPEQLISDREEGQIFFSEAELSETANCDLEAPGAGRWAEAFEALGAGVGDKLNPGVRALDELLCVL